MWARNYWPQGEWPQFFWPTFGSGTPIPPTNVGIMQVGGDGISKLTGFVTLTLSFPFSVSMRTE